jgi:4-amino-4-deoxy-L-arabinose transferase-like glycosyltransferase
MKTKLLYAFIGFLVILHLVMVLPALQYPSRFLTRDSYDYLDLARTFLSTGKYAGTVYPGVDLIRPPGYPIFVMIGLWIGQGETGLVSILQVFILFATAWLLYSICVQCGYRNAGLVAVIFLLLNPNAAFWSMVLMTETLAGFFLTIGLWCFVHYWKARKYRWLMGPGLAFSAGALTRPIIFPLVLVLGLIFFILEWRSAKQPIQAIKVSIVFFIGLLCLVLPWQLRNQVAHAQFTLSEVGESTFQNWYVAKTLASAEGYSRDEASAIIAKQANPMKFSLEVIRTYPVIFIKEQARGIFRTLLGAEYGTWATVYTGDETGTTGILSAFIDKGSASEMLFAIKSQASNPWFWAGMYALFYDIALGAAIVLGMWRVMRIYRQDLVFNLAVLVLVALVYLLIIPGVAGESRFRVPADPILALAGGWAFLPRSGTKTTPGVAPEESSQDQAKN